MNEFQYAYTHYLIVEENENEDDEEALSEEFSTLGVGNNKKRAVTYRSSSGKGNKRRKPLGKNIYIYIYIHIYLYI